MIGTAGSPPQFSDDFQPVLFGQQHVQDNHVHGCCLGALHSLAAIAGLDSLVSLTIEQLAGTSRVGASSSIISTRAMVHLSYTARRTILCRITNPKQAKRCQMHQNGEHEAYQGVHHGASQFLPRSRTRFPENVHITAPARSLSSDTLKQFC